MQESSTLTRAAGFDRPNARTAPLRRNNPAQKLRSVLGVFLTFCLLIALLPVSAFAAKETTPCGEIAANLPVVRIGWYEDSYHSTGDDGQRSGYGYEYEQSLAAYTGWQYDYVKGNWDELLAKLQRGEIDMMSALTYTDERAQKMLFSELPISTERYYLYANLDSSDISATDFSTIDGKRVGVMNNSFEADQLTAWEEASGIKTRHVYFSSIKQATSLAKSHKIDCIVSMETPRWSSVDLSALTAIGSSQVYFGISKSRPDIKTQLDNALLSLQSIRPFYADELYQKYLATQFVATATDDEKKWLAQHGSIKVGFLDLDPGISVLNRDTGELSGVITDYITAATHCLENQRLDFKLKPYHSAEELLQALGSGEIDMIFHVNQNPYYAEENKLALSNTVLTLPVVAISAQNAFNEDAKNRVAIEKSRVALYSYVSYSYPQWEIVECATQEDAERAVKNGDADCLLAGRTGEAMRYYNDTSLHSLLLSKPGNVSFAVCKGNTTLLSILNKTLTTMPTSKLSNAVTIYEESARKVTFMDYVRDNLFIAAMTIIVPFLIVVFAILMLLRRARLSERKAMAAMQRAKEADAAKSSFLFNMSHDIRTPMSAILGFSELAEKKIDDPELVRDYLSKIQMSGRGMLSILDNVLELSRIESRKIVLEETPQEADSVLDACMVMMSTEAQRKHHTITVDKEIEHPYVYLDKARATEIAVNLMSNAIKYTADGGSIRCTLRQYPHERAGWIYQELSVADNGIGMSEEFQQHVFEPFVRERSSTLSGVHGTGLGMGIVKNLVDLMEGTVTIDSKLGEGTTITVKIPVRLATAEDMKPKASDGSSDADAAKLRGMRVLLAEDNDLNAEIAITLLEEEGIVVERARDGVECVDKIEASPADHYALVLMDIQMPIMNGFEATAKIRELTDEYKARIPIIAMTANAFSEDRAKSLAAGMDDHLSKPIDMGELIAVLLRYV